MREKCAKNQLLPDRLISENARLKTRRKIREKSVKNNMRAKINGKSNFSEDIIKKKKHARIFRAHHTLIHLRTHRRKYVQLFELTIQRKFFARFSSTNFNNAPEHFNFRNV